MSGPAPLVAFNLLFLVPGDTGGLESYARWLIPELVRQGEGEFRFLAIVPEEGRAWSDRLGVPLPVEVLPVRSQRREQWVYGEQVLLPRALKRTGAALVHNMGATGPLRGRTPMITTTHDMIYHRIPEVGAGMRGWGMRALTPRVARRSDAVITVSQSSADDVREIAGLDPASIAVIPNAGQPPGPPASDEEVRRVLGADDRQILLYPTALRPHKNIAGLMRALALIPPEARPLVAIPGYETPYGDELRRIAFQSGVAEDARFLGWVSAEMIAGLYRVADALIFPSRYEGFGLPVLEAMQRGLPVISSQASSMPEVAGDAAVYFDPDDPAQMAAAIRTVLADPDLRASMAQRGLARAERFSWVDAAAATLDVYRTVLGR